MFSLRRSLLPALLLLPLLAFSGCEVFSSEAWQRPSPLSGPPPPAPEKHERGGGLAVLVGLPGQPTATRAVADLGAYAQTRGFVRQNTSPAPSSVASDAPAPEHYQSGDIKLDVVYQTAELRVTAFLHGFGSRVNRRLVDGFYQGFRQEYASRYGPEASVVETDYTEDAGLPASNAHAENRGGSQRRR